MGKKIEFTNTELEFLNLVLEAFERTPYDRRSHILEQEGVGFKPFAYMLKRKINHEKYGGFQDYNKYIKQRIRSELTRIENNIHKMGGIDDE